MFGQLLSFDNLVPPFPIGVAAIFFYLQSHYIAENGSVNGGTIREGGGVAALNEERQREEGEREGEEWLRGGAPARRLRGGVVAWRSDRARRTCGVVRWPCGAGVERLRGGVVAWRSGRARRTCGVVRWPCGAGVVRYPMFKMILIFLLSFDNLVPPFPIGVAAIFFYLQSHYIAENGSVNGGTIREGGGVAALNEERQREEGEREGEEWLRGGAPARRLRGGVVAWRSDRARRTCGVVRWPNEERRECKENEESAKTKRRNEGETPAEKNNAYYIG
ncbi:hypothetical protein DEO72_LG5g2183 [Vigna unguiculata]|uniref:Uncharacterized protein n=1 Tax=Vigna unguiculata TaxID=3917 RepID=A0A4D6M231_VIGUN|nr:hypothetical protein DEO72_LG5g2183 [Vigna unguiculata]